MSVFVEQSGNECCFDNSDSWVILSPIEMSIKRKIEFIGTPLKDWDIQINYGIKTGLNDAFIIDTEKRNEILLNCIDSDERKRTEEIIRPILRGRDIKRYSHDWANLWLIATFPSRHYDIEQYPAVKKHLLSYAKEHLLAIGYDWLTENYLSDYCKQKLSQTGQFISINGQRIILGNTAEKARKKTNNKWFETQDSISYWEDFIKPKIIWKRVGSILHFSYDEQFTMLLDSTCFATGNNLKYLCCILNSNMGHYLLKDAPKTGTGDLLVSVQAVEPLKIPLLENNIQIYDELLDSQIKKEEKPITNKINKMVYKLYNLSELEVTFIEHFVTQFQKNQ